MWRKRTRHLLWDEETAYRVLQHLLIFTPTPTPGGQSMQLSWPRTCLDRPADEDRAGDTLHAALKLPAKSWLPCRKVGKWRVVWGSGEGREQSPALGRAAWCRQGPGGLGHCTDFLSWPGGVEHRLGGNCSDQEQLAAQDTAGLAGWTPGRLSKVAGDASPPAGLTRP